MKDYATGICQYLDRQRERRLLIAKKRLEKFDEIMPQVEAHLNDDEFIAAADLLR